MGAIFGPDFVEVTRNAWQLRCPTAEADMTMCFPDDYPSCSPPTFRIDIPRCGDLRKLCQELTCLFTPGEEVAYQCCEHFLATCASVDNGPVVDVESSVSVSHTHASVSISETNASSMSKAEGKAEERARNMPEAQILENRTCDE